jgi:hypothetical protein
MCICLAFQKALLHFAEVAMHFERLFGGKVVETWLLPLLLLVSTTSLLSLASLLLFLGDELLAWQPFTMLGPMLCKPLARWLVIPAVGLAVAFATVLVVDGPTGIQVDVG